MKQLYEIRTYKQYDRDVKLAVRRGLDIDKLLDAVKLLQQGEPLPAKYRNHLLSGDYKGYWECHINPDWLLLYEKDTEIRIISLYRTLLLRPVHHIDFFLASRYGGVEPMDIVGSEHIVGHVALVDIHM